MNDMNGERVNVGEVLDLARFRGLPLLVLLSAGCITILDGFDIQIMGLASPALAREWGIDRSALAPAFAAALIGMAAGGFMLGWYGDRHGRRPALLLSVLCFALGTLATTWAANVPMLIVLRLLTGIGLGGALPNATALMAEFSPPRVRAQAIAAAIIGVPIGGMLGATIAAEIMPMLGWRVMFTIGGVLPLLAWVLIYFTLPESARFLATRPDRTAELAGVLNRIVKESRFSASQRFVAGGTTPLQHGGLRAILSRQLLPDTLALWIAFVTNLFAVYCFYNWAPVVLTSIGLELATAVRSLFVFNAAGVIGALAASWLIARLGSRWIQAVLGAVALLSMLYIRGLITADASPPVAAILPALAVAGFCIIGIQVTLFAVAAHVYPTDCRSAGVGWAQGMGRLGGVSSAFAGAILLDEGFFTGIAITLGLTVAAIVALKNHIAPVAGARGNP
jgi:MFS transporter, AAHS family, 4-hydroxybenzoate transporter